MARTDWRTVLRDAPVVEVKRSKKKSGKLSGPPAANTAGGKKRRYSPGVMHVLGVGERRIVGGIAQAASDYLKRSKKSASGGRDGALKDVLRNMARAQESALAQLAKIPRDLTKSREVQRGTKQVRRTLRRLAW